VSRVYTDLAVLEITREGLRVIAKVDDMTFSELQAVTNVPLIY
jgi:3-oxoadipate CoA-transferase beta subunit